MSILPPGQRRRRDLQPFGLPWYAHRMPRQGGSVAIVVTGLVAESIVLGPAELASVHRTAQASDFHCVTTWSRTGSQWAGVRFRDVYEQLIEPSVSPTGPVERIRFIGGDGYRDILPLADALRDDILLADELDGLPLSRGNGAPLRLVAPAHYGYKNVKYLVGIELLGPLPALRRFLPSLHHPRARVVAEERFHGLPGPVVRRLYRPAIEVNGWWFRRGMRRHP